MGSVVRREGKSMTELYRVIVPEESICQPHVRGQTINGFELVADSQSTENAAIGTAVCEATLLFQHPEQAGVGLDVAWSSLSDMLRSRASQEHDHDWWLQWAERCDRIASAIKLERWRASKREPHP